MPDLTGRMVANRYRVDALLGRGGMAEVYKVWDIERATFLALKLLRDDLAEDPLFLRCFQREARNLSRLQHPNIVRFYSLQQDELLAFILMDYVEGSNLRTEIARCNGKPLPPERIVEVMNPVCSALHYAHHQKMVHCDIKPANIMLEKSGKVLVADFGIARMSETATTMTMMGAGTPAFMAPEQGRGENPVPQSDIYALGVVLYEMLTGGERPFTGEQASVNGTTAEKVMWEHQHLEPPSPRKYNSAISPAMEMAVLKCLEKEPEKRFQSTLELLHALEKTVSENETTVLMPWPQESTEATLVDEQTPMADIPDFCEELGRHKNFIGRDWLKQQIDLVIQGISSGQRPACMLLLGKPGTGKSAFVAQQASTQISPVFHFLQRGELNLDNPGVLLRSLTAQLCTNYALQVQPDERYLSPTEAFSRASEKVSEKLIDGQHQIIWIDGLDVSFGSTARYSDVDLLETLGLNHLPKGIVVVMTSRPGGKHLEWLLNPLNCVTISLDAQLHNCKKDIREYLELQNNIYNHGLKPAFLSELVDASQGCFLAAVRYLCPRPQLNEALSHWQSYPEDIPKGIDGYLNWQWQGLLAAARKKNIPDRMVIGILGSLASGDESGREKILHKFLRENEYQEYRDAVLQLSNEFIEPIQMRDGNHYGFIHEYFAEFVLQKISSSSSTEKVGTSPKILKRYFWLGGIVLALFSIVAIAISMPSITNLLQNLLSTSKITPTAPFTFSPTSMQPGLILLGTPIVTLTPEPSPSPTAPSPTPSKTLTGVLKPTLSATVNLSATPTLTKTLTPLPSATYKAPIKPSPTSPPAIEPQKPTATQPPPAPTNPPPVATAPPPPTATQPSPPTATTEIRPPTPTP